MLNNVSKYCNWFMTMVSLSALGAFLTVHQRTVRVLRLAVDKKTFELTLFKAFGKPRVLSLPFDDVSGLRPGNFGFHSFDSLRIGQVWIDLDSNSLNTYPGTDKLVETILNGKATMV